MEVGTERGPKRGEAMGWECRPGGSGGGLHGKADGADWAGLARPLGWLDGSETANSAGRRPWGVWAQGWTPPVVKEV